MLCQSSGGFGQDKLICDGKICFDERHFFILYKLRSSCSTEIDLCECFMLSVVQCNFWLTFCLSNFQFITLIDILILIDTRVYRDAANYLSAQTRDILRQGCYVTSYPVEPVEAINTQKKTRIGGQMILAQPTWGGAIIKSSADRTGLGILTAITIRAATTDILLSGTYWPIPHSAEEHSRFQTDHLHQYIKKKE